MKKQNKKRINVQNTQLEGNFTHEKRKMIAIRCAVSARESSNMAMSFVVRTVKIFNMDYAYQDITRIIFQIQKMVTLLSVTPATKKTIQTIAQTNSTGCWL
jgi:hypothetical protein